MTGQPMSFGCQQCRRTIREARNQSRQTRTGNTKSVWRQRHKRTAHEYVCTCGHTGWSTHRDIQLVPLAEDSDPDPDPGDMHAGRGW